MSKEYSSRKRVEFEVGLNIGADLEGKSVQYYFEYFGDGKTQYYPSKENGFAASVERP